MLRDLFWKPYSHILIVGDNAGWSIDEDAAVLKKSMDALGIPSHIVKRVYFNIPQVVHYNSQFSLNEPSIYKSKHRISIDYYHGKPDQGENFRRCFNSLKENHTKISRVRVSTREMEEFLKTTGIDPAKITRIPIGIDTKVFFPTTKEKRSGMRKKLDIPENATVIGSFQKDGVGWGEGMEPKLIKGPDIFLKVISKIKEDIPNLWVLLSGPSRGYVKKGLDSLGIPYRHKYLNHSSELTDLYDALDLYIVTSREEGGPKAVLESMAKGIPLVTTEVGQAKDLVIGGKNAMIAPQEDIETLYKHSLEVLQNQSLKESLIKEGFLTAEANSHEAQLPLWQKFFKEVLTNNESN